MAKEKKMWTRSFWRHEGVLGEKTYDSSHS